MGEDVCDHICKLAKKGLTPSMIGVTLRDSFGIPQVKNVTGNKILRILKANGLSTFLPEDLYYLIKKSRGHSQTLGQEPQGQGCQVPLDSCGESHPQACSVLQACQVFARHVQVHLVHSLYLGGLSHWLNRRWRCSKQRQK